MTLELPFHLPRLRLALAFCATVASVGSMWFPWQLDSGSYSTQTYTASYFVYGTQCTSFGTSTECARTLHLAPWLVGVEALAVAAIGLALVGTVATWAEGRAPGRSLRVRRLARLALATGAIVSWTGPLAYCVYTYWDGTGLWTAPSEAAAGWYLGLFAGGLMIGAFRAWPPRRGGERPLGGRTPTLAAEMDRAC